MTAATIPESASDSALADAIGAGAADLSLVLTFRQIELLVAYLRLLARWNMTYNLTSLRSLDAMVGQHLLDCLAVVAPLRRRMGPSSSTRIVDVGSGGGLPGVVLAIAEPQWQVTCIDSVGKKAAFVRQVAASLTLPHLRALHGRIQAMSGEFDVVASRAFASLPAFVEASRHLLAPGGLWMAMKGQDPVDELVALAADVTFHVEPIDVPALDSRCVVWMHLSSERTLSI